MANIIGNGTILNCVDDSKEGKAIRVINRSGVQTFTNVQVTFTFSEGIEADFTQPSAPTDGTFDGIDTWTIPSMVAQAAETFNLHLKVTDSAKRPFTVSYTVTSDQHPDAVPGNDDGSRTFDADFSCEDFDSCTEINEFHGNVLYVSLSGDNLTAQRSSEHKTYRDPWAARADVQNGDTIYVYPGTYTFGLTALGKDAEWDTNNDSFNLIPVGITDINFYFEQGVILDVELEGDSLGDVPILFEDRGVATTIDISGYLTFISREKRCQLAEITNSTSEFSCTLSKIIYQDTSSLDVSSKKIFGQQSGIVSDIKVDKIEGTVNQIVQFNPTDIMYQGSFLCNLIKSEDSTYYRRGAKFFVIGDDTAVLKGQTTIKVGNIDITQPVGHPDDIGRGGQGVFEFGLRLNTNTAEDLQLSLIVDNYKDNIDFTDMLATGIQGSNPVVELGYFPVSLTNSDISFEFGNVVTGATFTDNNLKSRTLTNSTISYKIGTIRLTALNVLVTGRAHLATLNRSSVSYDWGVAQRVKDTPAVLVPLFPTDRSGAGQGTFTASKIIVTGTFITGTAGEPCVHLNNTNLDQASVSRRYLFKDCTFLVPDGNQPAIIATNADTEILIQNCVTNSIIPDAEVIERGMPIFRDLLYGPS